MQLDMRDVYDTAGNISERLTTYLSGHKKRIALLPSLELLTLHLKSNTDISIYEEAQPGLYFSFIGSSSLKTASDVDSVQISYCPKSVSGQVSIAKNSEKSLVQARISPSHLAAVLGETEEQIIQHFVSMRNKLGNSQGIIQLAVTDRSRSALEPMFNHNGLSISLAGHLYALLFTLIEQLQMLNHLSQCEDCQSKLFHAQNLIEAPVNDAFNIQHLGQQVGLNVEALSLGFKYIVGQSIEEYATQSKIKFAATQLRQNPGAKPHIIAQSGFSEDQFEAAFIQHFGVSSHQYGQIH